MAVAPLVTDFVEQGWRGSGIKRFTYIWQLQDFNDVIVQIGVPASLRTNTIGCSITFTDLTITYIGAVPTAIGPIFSLIPGVRYFPNWTTTATSDTVFYQGLNWIMRSDSITALNILLNVYSLAALATDDIVIGIDGYIERELLEGVQPVTLEGYKWPLTKRRA